MFCEECGSEVPPNSAFCNVCGTAVQQKPQAPFPNMNMNPNMNMGAPMDPYFNGNMNPNMNMNMGMPAPTNMYMNGFNAPPGMPPQNMPMQAVPPYAMGKDIVEEYSSKLSTAGVVWLVVGIIQIIIGGYTIMFQTRYNLFYVAIIGVLNIVNAIKRLGDATDFLQTRKGMAAYVENQNTAGLVVMGIWNVLFGGIVGIVATVFEVLLYNYGQAHLYEFRLIEQQK